MKRYLVVHELKPELAEFYANGHKTAHEGEYKGHFKSMIEAGANECLCWIYRNYSILYLEYDGPIEEFFGKIGDDPEMQKWSKALGIAFADSVEGEPLCAAKIYDVNEQVKGFLTGF